ncbi:sulfur carrier protein ThiS [Lysinibacter sp. HNR]|uniref:sulfur carrier protein ThiS n=1 Tax=Lysinibacter sp. HNR TaxID=3031408 RepID=UPI002434D3A2|nr:sulfur carrier protein ThiS [Lysinibacter sp. HNR]WGD36451.1 sulfur carrier protein ThiS [Lysinibacter sp. HNR]
MNFSSDQIFTINGEDQLLIAPLSLESVVRTLLDLAATEELPGGVAAAINDAVVPRSGWGKHSINAGDRIEVLGAVQGG